MMKKAMLMVLSALLATVVVDSQVGLAQEKARSRTVSASSAKATAPVRRLPTGFGSLKLSDEQKETIFRIREEHAEQMAELEQQLTDLRASMDKEFVAVLTADQKKMLTSQRAAKEAAAKTATATDETDSAEAAPKSTARSRTPKTPVEEDGGEVPVVKSSAKKKS